MTDDRNADSGTLSHYGHPTLARCLHHEPGSVAWFDDVRKAIAAEGVTVDAADWLLTEEDR